jgi:hypothetical protein
MSATGLSLPKQIPVEQTDIAGLTDVLRHEFESEVAALYPERPESSRAHLARVLATTFARILRARYNRSTKKIHVAPGPLARLPRGTDADSVLVHLVVHEAVHALDDQAVDLDAKTREAAKNPEALRALRMVIEGRATHYALPIAGILGADSQAAEALVAGRDKGELLAREAGRLFIAALEKRDRELPLKAPKSPPRLTSVVFHPERYGKQIKLPDVRSSLGSARIEGPVQDLSELLLRRRFRAKLPADRVQKAFSGFLTGAAVRDTTGRRISLAAFESDREAADFLAALAAVEGQSVEPGRPVRCILSVPGGKRCDWVAIVKGKFVAECLVRLGEDPLTPARTALSAATKR